MQDINLLRPQIKQQKEVSHERGRYTFYIAFTIILLLLVTSAVFGAKFILGQNSNSLDNQISNLEKNLGDARSTEDKINQFNSTIAQLQGLSKSKFSWPTFYENLAKAVPYDVKLNQVALAAASSASGSSSSNSSSSSSSSSTQSLNNSKVKIIGEAKSRRSIALFQAKLNSIGGNFGSADVISSNETQASASAAAAAPETVIDFEIDITLKL